MMKKKMFLITMSIFLTGVLSAQHVVTPDVPVLKGYKGIEGKITKFNFFNYLTLKDKPGTQSRKSTGRYWEVSYVYDSAFRQKAKFAEFIEKQISDNSGTTFFKDTTTIHFAIPDSNGNLWGKVLLSSNSVYKLKIIKEEAFNNRVVFDTEQILEYEEFVEPVELPSRMSFLPNSVVTRAEQSKFNHFTFSYSTEDETTFRQTLMGPYWEFKLEIQDDEGKVDKRVSYIEILESYYRAALKAKGEILKNRAREIIFNLPGDDYTLWIRVMVTIDGVYFIKVIEQSPADFKEPKRMYAKTAPDSIPGTIK